MNDHKETFVSKTPPSPEDVLSSSPFKEDVETALRAAPAGGGKPSSTLLLGVGALIAVAFFGGIQAHAQWGEPDQASGFPAAFPGGGYPGGAQGPGGGGPPGGLPGGGSIGGGAAGGGAAPGTSGKIKLITGTTVYVETADGSVVPVETSGSTKIQLTRTGRLKDLKPGATVTVQGDADSSGTVTASTITEGGAEPTSRPGN